MPNHNVSCLLIGPYDPHCGEYTFLAPPLGVWRLAGVLNQAGFVAEVFDPNITPEEPSSALEAKLRERSWDIVGISTTGMTLRYDLQLAHQVKRQQPGALLVAGGMEATFEPGLMFRLAPFELVVLGEGEGPMVELCQRVAKGESTRRVEGTAFFDDEGELRRFHRKALNQEELREAIAATPYADMPYEAYWAKLEQAYRVGELPFKAQREARLAEIRSVRLITLNYCPMNCTFCSSTNFLHAAQGSTAKIGRLEAEHIIEMLQVIVASHPAVRTVIFQDDIFVFKADRRILPLCEAILLAKEDGTLPSDLQFISTNRIDAMTAERLAAMHAAGFRVLGFGVESFSLEILTEFNKKQIYPHIEPMLEEALRLGITPFLDLILTSPRCSITDLATNICEAFRWLQKGCEVGMYPYVIPFSGAAMANDQSLEPQKIYSNRHIEGTDVTWQQPAKILPLDPVVREAILTIEERFTKRLEMLEDQVAHLPSRVRSILWIDSAIPVLRELGQNVPDQVAVEACLDDRLPPRRVESGAVAALPEGQWQETMSAL